jgi:hypothetical protein
VFVDFDSVLLFRDKELCSVSLAQIHSNFHGV